MQMHIMQLLGSETNVAFLYDPIFVETGEKSYAIYWSRSDANKVLKQTILRHKEKDPVFHTFTYPLKEVNFIPPALWKADTLSHSLHFEAEGLVLYRGASMVSHRHVGRIVAT